MSCRIVACCSAHLNFDYPRGAFSVGNDLQCQRATHVFERSQKAPVIGIRPCNCAIGGSAASERQKCIVGGRVSVDRDGVEGSADREIQRALQQSRRDGCIANDISQHRRHIGVNHARAFRAAEQADCAAGKCAARCGPFRSRVGSHDCPGKPAKAFHGAVGRFDQGRYGIQDALDGQRQADNSR